MILGGIMKKLLYVLGSTLLKKFLLKPSGSGFASQGRVSAKFNVPYLTDLARRYAISASVALVFSLFFVAGTMMALFSAAQSFDLFGVFVAGAVFYTGIGLMLISLAVIAACYFSIRNHKVLKEKIYLIEEEKAVMHSPLDYIGLAQPFVHGLIAGWRKERDKKYYAQAQDELFPADDDLGRTPRGNVAQFRAR